MQARRNRSGASYGDMQATYCERIAVAFFVNLFALRMKLRILRNYLIKAAQLIYNQRVHSGIMQRFQCLIGLSL